MLIFKSLFKDFRKAGHSYGWMERMEPGGLRRSAYSGAIQDRKCRAMLVAQMSNPMHCSSVLRRTFSLTSLVCMSWMVSWAKLISQPHHRQSWNCAFFQEIGVATAHKNKATRANISGAWARSRAHRRSSTNRVCLVVVQVKRLEAIEAQAVVTGRNRENIQHKPFPEFRRVLKSAGGAAWLCWLAHG